MPKPTPIAIFVSAVCALSGSLVFAADTGDAPDSYGIASHGVVGGAAFIGRNAPDDNDPVGSALADADDAIDGSAGGTDDEDGVFGFPDLVANGKSWSVNVFVSNPGSTAANLVAWVDFNGDGMFAANEASSDVVPPGADNIKIKLRWRDLRGVTSDFSGATFARFRLSSDALGDDDATGEASDGEVEDYTFDILEDVDGDEIPDDADADNDNDGIPDDVETTSRDTDADGTPDYLDVDSDGDGIPDFVEAGSTPASPVDTDGDGVADFRDQDSDNDGTPDSARVSGDDDGDGIVGDVEGLGDTDGDGVLNSDDIDSDNDLIPDAIEVGSNAESPLDSDGDGVPDFLDADSDNDGVPDLYEGSDASFDVRTLDTDVDGRLDGDTAVGTNGLADIVETAADSGELTITLADSDDDGIRDFVDVDSDADSVTDAAEAGGRDANADGVIDELTDADGDGIPDAADVDLTGGRDSDNDGIDEDFDSDTIRIEDTDGDGIVDDVDLDVDGDGLIDGIVNALFGDAGALPDTDADGVADLRDADAVGGSGGVDNGGSDDAGDMGGATGASDSGETSGETDAGGADGETAGDGTDDPGDTAGTDAATGGDTNGQGDGSGATDGTGGEATAGDRPSDDDDDGSRRIETGLSGYGGCSIGGDAAPGDPLFPGLALLTAIALAARRRRSTCGDRTNAKE